MHTDYENIQESFREELHFKIQLLPRDLKSGGQMQLDLNDCRDLDLIHASATTDTTSSYALSAVTYVLFRSLYSYLYRSSTVSRCFVSGKRLLAQTVFMSKHEPHKGDYGPLFLARLCDRLHHP